MTAGISYGAPTGASSLGDIAHKAPRQYGPPRNPVPDTVRIPCDRGEWTDLTLAALRFLWDAGYSTASIGAYLGFSKNAVVGKSHRLELPARPSPIIRDGEPPPPRRMPPSKTLPLLPSEVAQPIYVADWKTPERLAILTRDWPTQRPRSHILEDIEALEGGPLPSPETVASYARKELQLRRPGNFNADRVATVAVTPTAQPPRPPPPPQPVVMADPVRLPPPIIAAPKPYARIGKCAWTDSERAPWLWCGEPTVGGSWCARHRRIVFVRMRHGFQDAAD